MFKALKYLFLASLYKKAKKSFIMLFVYFILFALFIFITSDLLSIATGLSVYIILAVKWTVIPILLTLIYFSIVKIFNIASNPFESNGKEPAVKDTKKEKILSKEKLQTQSDLILQKYMKD